LEARGEEGENSKEPAGFESTSEGEVPVDEAEDLPF
jgi:hypothetical protein